MDRDPRHPLALASALACAVAIAACGSSNQAATVATSPPASQPTTAAPSTGATGPQAAHPRTTSSAPSAQPPQATRTAPAPAFVGRSAPGGPLGAAVAVVGRAGYAPVATSTFQPSQTLQVLVGTRGNGAAREQRAFFFVAGRYIGTDTSSPSESIDVVSQSDTAVTLRYAIYRTGSASPSGSQTVQFALDNGRLAPLGTIPPVSGPAGGRR